MVALLLALALAPVQPRHATPLPPLPPVQIVSVAKPYKQPTPHNARQRKLIAEGCFKVALHEWICPMPKPRRHK